MRDDRFARWLAHRRSILSLESTEALSRASGLPIGVVKQLAATASLSGVGRSGRAWLARALKVSLRDLEAIAGGRAGWIEDRRRVDLDRPLAWGRGGVEPMRVQRCDPAAGDGIPVLATAQSDGSVCWLDNHTPRRLPLRLDQTDSAFAVVVTDDRHRLFVPVLPSELRVGDRVVLSCSDGSVSGSSVMGELRRIDEERCDVADRVILLATLARCAREVDIALTDSVADELLLPLVTASA